MDNRPTTGAPFKALCDSERAQKATRLAMAIGPDADEAMLKDFANDAEAPIFKPTTQDIHRFFRAVTMGVTIARQSQNPDISTAFVVPPPDDDALDLDFQWVYCLRRERHWPPTPDLGEPNQDAMVLAGCRVAGLRLWQTDWDRARSDLGHVIARQVTSGSCAANQAASIYRQRCPDSSAMAWRSFRQLLETPRPRCCSAA